MDIQIPETKPMTAKEEIFERGIRDTVKCLQDARSNLKSINDQLETLQKSRHIWLDEVDRLSNLLSKVIE